MFDLLLLGIGIGIMVIIFINFLGSVGIMKWVFRKLAIAEFSFWKTALILFLSSIFGVLCAIAISLYPSDSEIIAGLGQLLGFIAGFYVAIRIFVKVSIPKAIGSYFLHYVATILVIFVPTFLIILCIRTYVISPFQAAGSSMNEMIKEGEYLLVSHFGDEYGRGDIIVYEPSGGVGGYYIHRIVGLPGEKVLLEDGKVRIFDGEHPDGLVLNEGYVRCPPGGCSYENVSRKEFEVPGDAYFVMGDNRMNSSDSRFCFASCSMEGSTPYVEQFKIKGKVRGIIWPWESKKEFPTPAY